MRRASSDLFAPYSTLGVVCSKVRPCFRTTVAGHVRTASLLVPIDNFVYHYTASKLRLVAISDPLPQVVTAVVATPSCVYAAAGSTICILPTCRQVEHSITLTHEIKFMGLVGNLMIVIDICNDIVVLDMETRSLMTRIEGSQEFEITALAHPATYINKILLGSKDGRLRIVNFNTCKVVHEFESVVASPITVLTQTPAVDVIGIGHGNGQIRVLNIREDELICSFKHDAAVTAIGFRNDGSPLMTSGDATGNLAVWNLEKRQLVGKTTHVHRDAVTELFFLSGEPIMVSSSADNSLRTWILDGIDGMPRQLVALEGHAAGVSALTFSNKTQVISAGLDGSVRKHDINLMTMWQKLGSAGLMSKKEAKKRHLPEEKIRLEPISEVTVGWQREAAWDNALCRHTDSLTVTTWTTRKDRKGTHNLLHTRFRKEGRLRSASATAICLSTCGNYGFVGYSTGYLDQFNLQSGRYVRTFTEDGADEKQISVGKNGSAAIKMGTAHDAAITGLLFSGHCTNELISTGRDGVLKFWDMRTGVKKVSIRTTRKKTIERAVACETNSLLALACSEEGLNDSITVFDCLCRRAVRSFNQIPAKRINALSFSADGQWLLVADNERYIRIFDMATSRMVDMMLFAKPCIGIAVSPTGEFIATIHQEERAVFIWANKSQFAPLLHLRSYAPDFMRTWENPDETLDLGVVRVVIESDDEASDDDDIVPFDGPSLETAHLTYSGLPPSRWENLPDISLIKERNKPLEPPRKTKQVPFFLAASATMTGFEFDAPLEEDEVEQRKRVQAKRNLLELETSFTQKLKGAATPGEYLRVFALFKEMSVSAIDYEIRSLPPSALLPFFTMIREVLKARNDFDIVQSFLAAAIKIHRSELWTKREDEESCKLTAILEDISLEQAAVWEPFENLLGQNATLIQWIKNALI